MRTQTYVTQSPTVHVSTALPRCKMRGQSSCCLSCLSDLLQMPSSCDWSGNLYVNFRRISFLHSPLIKITMVLFFFKFSVTQTFLSGFINVKLIHKYLHGNNFKSLLLFIPSPSYWHKANQRSPFRVSWYFDSFYPQDLFTLSWVLILIHINLTSSGSSLLLQKSGCFSGIKNWNLFHLSP